MRAVATFPRKVTRELPRTQMDELRSISSRELLSALAMKYPDLRFTADEILRAKGRSVTVEWTADNEWRITPAPPTENGGIA